MCMMSLRRRRALAIELVCVDVDGTLTDGILGPALPGAVAALGRVVGALPVRVVTNATSVGHGRILANLVARGFAVDASMLVTPLLHARRVLPARGHDRGVLVAEAETRRELGWFTEDDDGPAVLLAGEVSSLRIEDLQPAFRRLLRGGATFYTVQRNRYFRRAGELVTDAGPLVAFFEYATGVRAEVLGKPSASLFDELAQAAGVARGAMVMVGDDAEFDVARPRQLGLEAVLVRTGKYRPGDEARHEPVPSAVLGSVAELPDWLGVA
jgi:HAD superfamily hydrolase (TIGR01458 family)